MAGNVAVMTRKGQITIPVEIRRALDLKEGDQIVFVREGATVRLESAESLVRRTAGSLSHYRLDRTPTIEELKQAFEEAVVEDVMVELRP